MAELRALGTRESSQPPLYCCAYIELSSALAFVWFTHNYSIYDRWNHWLFSEKLSFSCFPYCWAYSIGFRLFWGRWHFTTLVFKSYNNIILRHFLKCNINATWISNSKPKRFFNLQCQLAWFTQNYFAIDGGHSIRVFRLLSLNNRMFSCAVHSVESVSYSLLSAGRFCARFNRLHHLIFFQVAASYPLNHTCHFTTESSASLNKRKKECETGRSGEIWRLFHCRHRKWQYFTRSLHTKFGFSSHFSPLRPSISERNGSHRWESIRNSPISHHHFQNFNLPFCL